MSFLKNNSIREYLKIICSAGACAFLFCFVALYSFYAPEGYIRMATNKYEFFKKMCSTTTKIMIPLTLLYYVAFLTEKGKGFHKKIGELFKGISVTDAFVLLFILVNIISYYYTDFRDEALWGTNGWYMGLIIHLYFAGMYFMMSRFCDGRIAVLSFFMIVTSALFLWGLSNRFSVYPVEMAYSNPAFISSMGNINWFCGFWSVFFSIGAVLYLFTENSGLRFFSAAHMVISFGLGVVEGSDSAFISMGIVILFLYFPASEKICYLERFLEAGIIFCGTCQVMRFVAICRPESLNMCTTVCTLMLGNLTLTGLLILLFLRFFLEYKIKGAGDDAETQMITKIKLLRNTIFGIIAMLLVIYVILLVVNTKNPGSIGKLSEHTAVFLFDQKWGSNRGSTWREGIEIFKSFPFAKKIIGVGPDCFSAYAYSVPELAEQLTQTWGGDRLTNAHNECITYMVNIGILGAAAFVGIFVSSFIRLAKKGTQNPLCYVYAASLLSYFLHNQFSFSTTLNTPYVFVMLGLAENLIREKV